MSFYDLLIKIQHYNKILLVLYHHKTLHFFYTFYTKFCEDASPNIVKIQNFQNLKILSFNTHIAASWQNQQNGMWGPLNI